MNFAVLGYSNTQNIGDSIQSVAVLQHVDQDYKIIDRDRLNEYSGEPCVVVMNGWFSHKPQNWPPAEAITPIFFGFHLTPETAAAYSKHAEYFRKYEPIGCRDEGTAEIIRGWGVEAYVSGCATMTFPERSHAPENGKTFIVDVRRRVFNKNEYRLCNRVSQTSHIDYMDDAFRNAVASNLLSYYRDNASQIITNRIHCAMPCFAMGIPVIYCGAQEYRTKIIEYIGVSTIKLPKIRKIKLSNLNFKNPNFDSKKQEIAGQLRSLLSGHGVKLKDWTSKSSKIL